jgi:hypothetical protein
MRQATCNNASFVNKMVVVFISVGAQFTPATLQTFKLIVRFEGAHSLPTTCLITQALNYQRLIITSIRDKIPFTFHDEQIVFCEGEWEKIGDMQIQTPVKSGKVQLNQTTILLLLMSVSAQMQTMQIPSA